MTVSQGNKVPIGKRLIPGGFRKAYYSVPYSDAKIVRQELSKLCYWTYQTFRAKIKGKRYFTVFEVEIIEKYFAEKGIDAWTGEEIEK